MPVDQHHRELASEEAMRMARDLLYRSCIDTLCQVPPCDCVRSIALALDQRAEQERERCAKMLDAHRPHPAQLEHSPDYNNTVVRVLEWAAAAIRGQP